jgi:hypothetical protein
MKALKWWHWVLIVPVIAGLAYVAYLTYQTLSVKGKPLPAGYEIEGDEIRLTLSSSTAGTVKVVGRRVGRVWSVVLPASDLDRRAVLTANVNGLGLLP